MFRMVARIFSLVFASAVLTVTSPASAETSEEGEAELGELLQGRIATGEVDCLSRMERRNMRIIENTAIVFEAGDTIYVNRPEGARFLGWNDIPVFKIWGGDLCRNDHVVLADRSSGIPGPNLQLNAFKAYSRPEGVQP